jgi:hypothetical protein
MGMMDDTARAACSGGRDTMASDKVGAGLTLEVLRGYAQLVG